MKNPEELKAKLSKGMLSDEELELVSGGDFILHLGDPSNCDLLNFDQTSPCLGTVAERIEVGFNCGGCPRNYEA